MVHFSECSTVAANCNAKTRIEMRDGTVGHFPDVLVLLLPDLHAVEVVHPEGAHRDVDLGHEDGAAPVERPALLDDAALGFLGRLVTH